MSSATAAASTSLPLDCLELCRLCLVKDSVNVPIFEDEGDVRQIFLKIAACLPVKVSKTDKLPKKICDECMYKVETFYQFWNTTANAEKQLLEWLGEESLEDKEGYEVLDSNVMKQERRDNRLDGNVIQISEHQNNIEIGIMDNMSLIHLPDGSEQYTAVPMDASGTIQVVRTISQAPHNQSQVTHLDEVASEIEDNSDGCDNEESGFNVKEEHDDGAMDTSYVTISSDQAGPSGLQQAKEAQEVTGDPKTQDESFGGLSGMLRHILSPTAADTDDLNYAAANVHILQQQSPNLFNTHNAVLSNLQLSGSQTLSQTHDMVMQEAQQQQQQTGYQDQVQILTETHICPNCGIKLSYQIRAAHNVIQLMDVGESQLMRFTCYSCSRSFVAQSHVKPNTDQVQPLQPQQIINIAPRIQSPGSSSVNYQPEATGAVSRQTAPTTPQQQQVKSFSCEHCQASFRYRTLLDKHKRMHAIAAGQDKPYSCPRCFMRFETRNLYNHHAKIHKPLEGQSDKISAAGSSKDSTALLYNKASNTYSCETCAKEFPTIESLTSHKSVHRSRPLVCDVCGKGFTHRKYYVVHQRIHTGERPYLCAMCGKSFTQASTLTVHRRYHTGERPYTCTTCGKGFVTRTIMLNHMKKH